MKKTMIGLEVSVSDQHEVVIAETADTGCCPREVAIPLDQMEIFLKWVNEAYAEAKHNREQEIEAELEI
jgi:hypothetical protein